MTKRILVTLALLLFALAIYGRLWAVDRPPGSTLPPAPEPFREWTYLPAVIMQDATGDWMWPAGVERKQ